MPAIAEEVSCRQKTVRRWLHRFNRSGLEGLEKRGGQGVNGGSPRRSGHGSSLW
ncbi:helix-turn-helix domain-containing protein [Streptomyces sp. ISL-100]|uniref:helix-turn-helix domain-containing protein n=1 Tax=Streptomyces sp. ISL-100 TaxID=2819173 RepID=UPI0027E3EC6C|nr:helix-turn-helix domain-containing protein [Streptomyces sp. ISL-100]